MKKIVSILIAICLCVPVAIVFAGCKKESEAGLYDLNGNRSLTWKQFVAEYPHAFEDNGKILVNNDYVDSNGSRTASAYSSVLSQAGIGGNLVVDGSVRGIDDYAFAGCYGLYRIKILSGVKTIDKGAFSNCSNLERVVIDSADAYECIRSDTFDGCYSLKDVYVLKSADKKKHNDYLNGSDWQKSEGEGKYQKYYRYSKIA